MLERTTYDGTPETLPRVNRLVLLWLKPDDKFPEVAELVRWAGKDPYYNGGHKPTQGEQWAYLPTPAECKAWGQAKQALEFYKADDESAVECGILEDVSKRPATAALAALDAAGQGGA